MSWRYQPVYIEHNVDDEVIKEFSLCEVYLDSNDKLEMWTEKHEIAPHGNDIEDLVGSVELMLNDARRWKAVPFESLRVGMKLEEV